MVAAVTMIVVAIVMVVVMMVDVGGDSRDCSSSGDKVIIASSDVCGV